MELFIARRWRAYKYEYEYDDEMLVVEEESTGRGV
jgi:hypothetical protein